MKCSGIVAGESQSEESEKGFGGPSRNGVWKSWPSGFYQRQVCMRIYCSVGTNHKYASRL